MTEQEAEFTTNQATDVARLDPSEAQIALLREEYMQIEVSSPADTENFERATRALKVMVSLRTGLDKTRLDLGEEYRERIKFINGRAKDLQGKMDPVEAHLVKQRKVVLDERERLEREAVARVEALRKARLDARLERLQNAGARIPASNVEAMTEEEFQQQAARAEQANAERKQREDQERADREASELAARQATRLEKERLDKQRAELDAQRKEQDARDAAAREKLEADRKALADQAESDRKEREQRAFESERARKVEDDRRLKEQQAAQLVLDKQRADLEAQQKKIDAENQRLERERAAKQAEADRKAREKAEKERRARLAEPLKQMEMYVDGLYAVPLPNLPEYEMLIRGIRDEAIRQLGDLVK